jgi:hypothetical protein
MLNIRKVIKNVMYRVLQKELYNSMKSMAVRSGERGGHAIGAALPIHRSGKRVFEILAHFSKVMRGCTVLLEVNTAFLVIFVQLWNEELL